MSFAPPSGWLRVVEEVSYDDVFFGRNVTDLNPAGFPGEFVFPLSVDEAAGVEAVKDPGKGFADRLCRDNFSKKVVSSSCDEACQHAPQQQHAKQNT